MAWERWLSVVLEPRLEAQLDGEEVEAIAKEERETTRDQQLER